MPSLQRVALFTLESLGYPFQQPSQLPAATVPIKGKTGTAAKPAVSAASAAAKAKNELVVSKRKWQTFKEGRTGRFEIRYVAIDHAGHELNEIA